MGSGSFKNVIYKLYVYKSYMIILKMILHFPNVISGCFFLGGGMKSMKYN